MNKSWSGIGRCKAHDRIYGCPVASTTGDMSHGVGSPLCRSLITQVRGPTTNRAARRALVTSFCCDLATWPFHQADQELPLTTEMLTIEDVRGLNAKIASGSHAQLFGTSEKALLAAKDDAVWTP